MKARDLAELAARNSEYGERIEQQSATIDVLKVMSASPGDPQPVFDLITRRARELCNANGAGLYGFDGELAHILSLHAAHPPEIDDQTVQDVAFYTRTRSGEIISMFQSFTRMSW